MDCDISTLSIEELDALLERLRAKQEFLKERNLFIAGIAPTIKAYGLKFVDAISGKDVIQ